MPDGMKLDETGWVTTNILNIQNPGSTTYGQADDGCKEIVGVCFWEIVKPDQSVTAEDSNQHNNE